jgi:hypothetical protein
MLKLAAAFAFGLIVGVLALPLWRTVLMNTYQSEYGKLTYMCDSAMRMHNLAKARVSETPTEDQGRKLKQAEIALIDCQDYDLLQKKLMTWGLRETELGQMRLRAIEANADGLRDVIDVHEIRD